MARFYGVVDPMSTRKQATRCGQDRLKTIAAGWSGAIEVVVFPDPRDSEVDVFQVNLIPWKDSGGEPMNLISGVLDSNSEFQILEFFGTGVREEPLRP